MSTSRRVLSTLAVLLAVVGLVSVAVGRTWTSSDGRFTTDATLVEVKDGKVTLRKPNGKELKVPLSQLSDEDQRFVREHSSGDAAGPGGDYRPWASRDGKFTTRARMLDYRGGKVRLQKADGKELDVPIGQLSDEDRRWVADEMRRRRQSARDASEAPETGEAEAGGPDEVEDEAESTAGPTPGDDEPITGSLGAQTVDMKLVSLRLPRGRKRRADPLTQYLLEMTNPQTFFLRSNPGGNRYEEQFRKLVKKEPEYASKEVFRAVAHFGSMHCAFALDVAGKKSKGYDRLYFDANGNGDLTDDEPIDTKDVEAAGEGKNKNVRCGFRGIKVPLENGSVQVEHPLRMEVRFRQMGALTYTTVQLFSAAVREGQIDFGGRKIRLLLVDHNSNGRFDDRVAVHKRGSRLFLSVGDVFLVNPSARKARSAAASDYFFVNRSVCIGGHFYKMETTPAGDRLTLEPIELAMGRVSNPSPAYRAVVYNDEYGALMIGGVKDQEIVLPEGEWRLANYTIHAVAMVGGRRTMVAAEFSGDAKAVSVEKDATVELPFGAPFHAVVTAKPTNDGKVALSLSIFGKGGERCTNCLVKGRRPPNPTFKVLDKEGKTVYAGKFEYG